MSRKTIDRRTALQMGATAGLGLVCGSNLASAATATADKGAKEKLPMRFDDPIWNRETSAKLQAHTDPNKFVYGSGSGVVCGVRDNERVKELLGFDIFSTMRCVRQPDGSYQRLCREVVFYRDLKTKKLLDEWDNPYTGERVRVVDVANDPFNYVISEFFPDPPSYGGLNKEKPPKRPYLLNWSMMSDDVVSLDADIHLFYPSALQPDKWPRESPGKMSRVSELFRYFIRREDIENPKLTHLPHHGVWSRITPWLPWMMMDQAPGHVTYLGTMGTRETLESYPRQDVIQRVKERYPQYLTAPTVWVDPSLSSLERYAREQKPAPVKPKS